MGEAGADVVGVDWRVPLADGIGRVGGRAVQGNLDPTLVFAPTEVMLARATEVVEAGRAAPGHIFNLGHGVLPVDRPGPAGPAHRPRALPRDPAPPPVAPRRVGLSGGVSGAVGTWRRYGAAAARPTPAPRPAATTAANGSTAPSTRQRDDHHADQRVPAAGRARPGSRRPAGRWAVRRTSSGVEAVTVIVDIEVWSAR